MAKAPSPAEVPALAHTLNQRVEDLRDLVTRALRSWDVEAIHHARVTTRRLKAAIDLLRPLLPEEPRREFSRALRRLRRTLGPLRDLDVMLLHLDGLRVVPAQAEGVSWVARRLRERRTELRNKAGRGTSPRQVLSRLAAWVDLDPAVREAQAAASLLLRSAAPDQARSFAERANNIASRPASDAAAKPAADASTEDVHELRIAGKLLRYTLELAEPIGFTVAKEVTREFKKLQDALGQWHDYAVLTDEMLRLALESRLSAHRPETFGAVLHLARLCWQKGQRHLDQFRRLWAEGGEVLTARVLEVFTGADGAAGGSENRIEPEPTAAPDAPPSEPAAGAA